MYLTKAGLAIVLYKYIVIVFNTIVLFINKITFGAIDFGYRFLEIASAVNLSTISGFLQGITNRITAVIIVVVIYNLAVSIIRLMSNNSEKEIKEKSASLLKNVFITAALLIGYNLIFGLLNELSLLVMGNKIEYDFPILSQVVTIDKKADEGILSRLIFAENSTKHIGKNVACSFMKKFFDGVPCEKGFNYNSWQLAYDDYGSKHFGIEDLNPKNWFKEYPNISFKPFWFIAPFFAGIFAFYIISNGLKILLRAFKLTFLQMCAPIPISSILIEGTGKESKFSKYISSYIATYTELFIRVFCVIVVTAVLLNFEYFVNGFINGDEDTQEENKTAQVINSLDIPVVAEQKTVLDDVDIKNDNDNNNNDNNSNDNNNNNNNSENDYNYNYSGNDEDESTKYHDEIFEYDEDDESYTKESIGALFYILMGVGGFLFINEAPKLLDQVLGTSVASSMGAIGNGILGSLAGFGKGALSGKGLIGKAVSATKGSLDGYNKGKAAKDAISAYDGGKTSGATNANAWNNSKIGKAEAFAGSAITTGAVNLATGGAAGAIADGKDKIDKLKEANDALAGKKEGLVGSNATLKEGISAAQGKIAALKNDKAAATNENKQLTSKGNDARRNLSRLENSRDNVNKLDTSLNKIGNIQDKIARAEEEFNSLPDNANARGDELINQIEAGKQELQSAIQEYEMNGGTVESDGSVKVKVRQEALKRTRATIEREISNQSQIISECETQINNNNTIIANIESEIQSATQTISDNEAQISINEAEIANIDNEIQSNTAEMQVTTEAVSNAQNSFKYKARTKAGERLEASKNILFNKTENKEK